MKSGTDFGYRGYTGHEHLTEFGLINMNARLYDPILGRFLGIDPYVSTPDFAQGYNRYSYCLNNPLIYTDPSGEFFFLIPSISWSKNGGLSIGLTAIVGIPGIISVQAGIGYSFNSNDFSASVGTTAAFNTLYASYSTQNGGSVGWSAGLSPQMGFPISTNVLSVGANYNITHNSWSGNLSAWSISQNGWEFNPSLSVMVYPEHTTNWVRGKGFNSNDKVLENFIWGRYDKDWSDDIGTGGANWYNAALKYFGFKGTYDPNIVGSAQFDTNDGSIKYRDDVFSSYDRLRAAYKEELFHSKDYLTYKSKMPTGISDEHAYEEFRAQVHMYKNQGLYPKSGFKWGDRINIWGSAAGVNPDKIIRYNFDRPWWHFVYKIPRKW